MVEKSLTFRFGMNLLQMACVTDLRSFFSFSKMFLLVSERKEKGKEMETSVMKE